MMPDDTIIIELSTLDATALRDLVAELLAEVKALNERVERLEAPSSASEAFRPATPPATWYGDPPTRGPGTGIGPATWQGLPLNPYPVTFAGIGGYSN